ncbi:MAG: pyridoxamine 5'-phosphate oxidase family protein [Spirochaetaceae bacterium]|nr:MAG: pyridoxamine 5'-phosphate oxidase family protein [Spirochaetaceae bacterium]
MDVNALFDVMERLIEESKVAVLANVDQQGQPRMRWMSPTVIRGQSGCLYALTAPDFVKTSQLQQQPAVEWMIQGPALQEVLRVRGTVELIDNPALKSDVLEALGGRLGTFWRSNPDPSNMIVLETIIEELVYYQPMKDLRYEVRVDR